ncbi:DUF1275 domain-containing protein [Fodinisporobacter ferrooxydans]|uniref:DUF1275 domain-containing protein n=1 Tax=Fodinisporobacter ferrooxydans TaxID=2901836 RepID=A0ABY4CS69_9BACL|nr:DUF1275 domain-containing protein [Alicyclobacillaceae bacterium MYW30-H2]
MSRTVCNILLVLLTVTSGCVDAIGFLGLGQVFTAAMTGNTVLFGLAIVHSDGLNAIAYLVALFGFILGAAAGAVMLRRIRKTTGWSRTVTFTLCFELAALVLFAIIVSASGVRVTRAKVDLMLLILAFAMGVQGVAARRIGVNGVTTTVITSTLTGLVETLVWKFGNNRLRIVEKSENTVPLISIVMWITVIVFYGMGAAICGAIEHHWQLQAIWLPIAIVFTVIVTAAVSEASIAAKQKTEISL